MSYLNAQLDEFQIFDRALTPDEVHSLTTSPAGGTGGGNVAWYRFDETGGPGAVDSSGKDREPASSRRPTDGVIRDSCPRIPRRSSCDSRSSPTYGGNQGIWAPYYTLHKILAGLLDAHHAHRATRRRSTSRRRSATGCTAGSKLRRRSSSTGCGTCTSPANTAASTTPSRSLQRCAPAASRVPLDRRALLRHTAIVKDPSPPTTTSSTAGTPTSTSRSSSATCGCSSRATSRPTTRRRRTSGTWWCRTGSTRTAASASAKSCASATSSRARCTKTRETPTTPRPARCTTCSS